MLKNIALLVSSSVSAQAIAVVFLPILSRLYDDRAFGIFQIYVTTLNVFLMVSALRYEVAVLASRTQFALRTLLRLAVRLNVAMAVLTGLAIWLAMPLIRSRYPDFALLVWIFPILVCFAGVFNILNHLIIRKRRYRLSAQVKMIQSSVYVGSGIVLALGSFTMLGLVIADALARLASSSFILTRLPRIWHEFLSPVRLVHAKFIAWKFRDYPIYSMPGALMSALLGAVVPIAFAGLYDLSVAGQYAFVERFLLLPVGLVAGAAAQVVTGDFAEYIRKTRDAANKKFRQIVFILTAVAILPAFLLYFSAPIVVPYIFGPEWALAGKICQIAVPIAVIRFVAGPMHLVLVICNKQSVQFTWEILRFIITIGGFGLVIVLGIESPLDVMRLYVLSVVLSYVVYLLIADRVTLRLANQPDY